MPGDVIGPLTAEAAAADGPPGGHPGRGDRQRQGGRDARRGLARRDDGAGLARHLHRRDGARPREPQEPTTLLDELRLRPASLPLREPRHPPRDVDADLVPRPARRRSWPSAAASLGLTREEYIEREAAAGARRQRRVDDRARLARPDRQAVPQGRHARLRRPPHARPRLPLDPRGDRADDEAQRRRDVRRARHRARRRSSSRAAAPRARSSCRSSPTSSASRPRAASARAAPPRRGDLRRRRSRASTRTSSGQRRAMAGERATSRPTPPRRRLPPR